MARSFVERFVGLMLEASRERCFLVIPDCSSVHTFFMRQAIDLVFLDSSGSILGVREAVRPWRVNFGPRGTRTTVELPSGTSTTMKPGDRLVWQSS